MRWLIVFLIALPLYKFIFVGTNDIKNGLYPADNFKKNWSGLHETGRSTLVWDRRRRSFYVSQLETLQLSRLTQLWCFVSQKCTNRKFALFFDSRLPVAIIKQCYRFLWLQNYLKTLKITATANADAHDFELSSFWICRLYPWTKFAACQAFFVSTLSILHVRWPNCHRDCVYCNRNHSGLLITRQITGISLFAPFNHLNNLCVLSDDEDHPPLIQCSVMCFHFWQFLFYVLWVCTVSGKKQKTGV